MGKGMRYSLRRNGVSEINKFSFGSPALGAVAAVMAAFTSAGNYQKVYNKATLYEGPAKKVTATFAGVEADIKAIQVTVIGTDNADAPLTEALPAATVNTAGTVTSVGSFKTVTEIRIPVHDGLGATTAVGLENGGTGEILAAWTDKGVQTIHKCEASIADPAVARNVTATAGGTAADVADIQVIVNGRDRAGDVITETLPIFTENATGTVVGSKGFGRVDSIEIPPHDGTGATTSVGTGAKLAMPVKLPLNQILAAYINSVREATAPTVVADAANLSGNLITLSTALSAVPVEVHYWK